MRRSSRCARRARWCCNCRNRRRTHRVDHVVSIGHGRSLHRAVHGQLGQANVRHRDGKRVALQVAQGAAARLIGAVGEHLHRHTSLAADFLENRTADGVGGVLLAGVVLQHNALAHMHRGAWVGFLREVRVGRVGVVGAEHVAVCHGLLLCLGAVGDRIDDAVQHCTVSWIRRWSTCSRSFSVLPRGGMNLSARPSRPRMPTICWPRRTARWSVLRW